MPRHGCTDGEGAKGWREREGKDGGAMQTDKMVVSSMIHRVWLWCEGFDFAYLQ